MEPWILVTFAAVIAQTARFALQKALSGGGGLSAAGATFSRFVWSFPLAALAMVAYAQVSGQGGAGLTVPFWAYAMTGGLAQILATVCVVTLFRHRNFAVGITFKKTEVILAVLVSLVVLGEGVSLPAFGAILLGLVGVLMLSDPPDGAGAWHRRIWNRAAGLGLASGLLFGISGVGYRGASLALAEGDAGLRALTTLSFVTLFQTLAMLPWLLAREPGEIGRVFAAWRVTALVGITSVIGSGCWFLAFTLESVGLVKAVGQSELILSLLVSWLIFGERISARELAGMAVLSASILALILLH